MKTIALLFAAITLAAQTAAPPQLRANRDTYHPVTDFLKDKRATVTDEQMAELAKFPLEAIWGTLRGLGYTNSSYAGLKPTRPSRLVGRALTLRYLPRRPDLVEAMQALAKEGDWPVAYNVRAAEDAKPGDVLVVDLGGGIPDGVFFGDISALGAQMAGARGAVLYGSSRDLAELREMDGFPVFAVGYDPNVATQIGVDWNVPVRVGSATVLPGDVVVAEEEAVLFFPASIVPQLLERVRKFVAQEEFERELTRGGKHRFRDVYPLNPELRMQFEADWEKKRPQ
jgi:4-hydroxy-4-methyl-2-oxoglutarate aldolase